MSVQNSLNRSRTTNKVTVVHTDTGDIQLSSAVVRNYLVNGGGNVSDQEVSLFIALCSAQKLNPLIREAYLIKYGNSPATMIVSKDVYQKRANKNPNYLGKKAGVIVYTNDGTVEYRQGALVIEGERLLGGWCEVFKKGYETPERVEVSYSEYEGRKANGEPNNQWKTKPATMIRKVAVAQALREAFTEDYQGLYTAEEMGINEEELSKNTVEDQSKMMNFEEAETTTREIPQMFDDPMA